MLYYCYCDPDEEKDKTQNGEIVKSRPSKDSKWYCKMTFKLLTHLDKGADVRPRLMRASEVTLNHL